MKAFLTAVMALLTAPSLSAAVPLEPGEGKDPHIPEPVPPVPTPTPAPPKPPNQTPVPAPPPAPEHPPPVPTPEPPAPERLPANDAEFVTMAAKNGLAALKLADLGAVKAGNDKVKELARMLVREFTAANDSLKAVAATIKVTFPDSTDQRSEEKYRAIKRMSAEEFDAAFLTEIERVHAASIRLREAARKTARHPDVKALIDTSLPVVKRLAEHIRDLNESH
jgi:putative membrane protein